MGLVAQESRMTKQEIIIYKLRPSNNQSFNPVENTRRSVNNRWDTRNLRNAYLAKRCNGSHHIVHLRYLRLLHEKEPIRQTKIYRNRRKRNSLQPEQQPCAQQRLWPFGYSGLHTPAWCWQLQRLTLATILLLGRSWCLLYTQRMMAPWYNIYIDNIFGVYLFAQHRERKHGPQSFSIYKKPLDAQDNRCSERISFRSINSTASEVR